MKKTLLNSLLVAVGLLAGTMGALHPTNSCAQTKKILASQDYETATTGDWTCPNGSVNFKTGDATYGNYVGSAYLLQTIEYQQNSLQNICSVPKK